MEIKINPSHLSGEVVIPPSKSLSHRSIIAASLAKGISVIENVILSEDILATIDAMKQLGVQIEMIEGQRYTLKIQGTGTLTPVGEEIYCNESGSTLRFLIPFFTLIEKPLTFTGRNKLIERPLESYYKIFNEQGIKYETAEGNLPLTVKGNLAPGTFKIDGDISSQFITGLMFVLPLLEGDSEIIINKTLESKGYVDLTMDILSKFGIDIINDNYERFMITGHQTYKPCDYHVEGDYSQGAFYIVANLIGNNIVIKGLEEQSLQGDQGILDIVKAVGGDYNFKADGLHIIKDKDLKGITIDVKNCPDLVPILGVLGSFIEEDVHIINAERLRIKESDRLKAISSELNKLGCHLIEQPAGLLIKSTKDLSGGYVTSWNDHRIAMALSIISTQLPESIHLSGAEAINKSYPKFYEDFKTLGGEVHGV